MEIVRIRFDDKFNFDILFVCSIDLNILKVLLEKFGIFFYIVGVEVVNDKSCVFILDFELENLDVFYDILLKEVLLVVDRNKDFLFFFWIEVG